MTVFQPTNSFGSPLACLNKFFWPHVIVHSLPTKRDTGSLRYSNNAELLRVKIVRIELVEDFFVELMLAAKFPYPVPTVSLGVY